MKKVVYTCGLIAIMWLLTGCGASDENRGPGNSNSVNSVIQKQIESVQNAEKQEGTASEPQKQETEETEKTQEPQEEKNDDNTGDTIAAVPVEKVKVDIDISVMGSDMVYATVYQLMVNPDEYLGKVIRIKGIHQSNYYEPTGLTYHYAIIQDATACCAQGIEFEMAGGAAFPPEGVEVTVTGTFDVYEEEGYLYCTLRNAVTE